MSATAPVSNFDSHHEGLFVRTPNLVYVEEEMTSCYLDPDMISVDDIKAKVVDMGYTEHSVRKLHLRKPNVGFEEALVPIENDEHVHYIIRLFMNKPSVSIYVEHEDDDNWLQGDVLEGVGLEELDISLSDPEFELFSDDDDGQSETDDEDISLLRETAEVNHRALDSSHAPSQLDRMTMIPTPQTEPILPAQDRATVLTPLTVATAQAGQIVANREGTVATVKQIQMLQPSRKKLKIRRNCSSNGQLSKDRL
ncbi:hypothetical protein Cgig2_023235 [Carnegiea gigantea]|uniref:PB1-like domain-containing protein n=1 Tax=Carnegiea gigantea TaxID=171969 RepID=A0A9Q1JL59_9CARY|nr:hypothetical protein Cgig2_023235 [Carnegiea gigantea]